MKIGSKFLHDSVAAKICHLIENGTLRPGDRVMSVRRAARAHGVSLTTAVRAYMDIEALGLIEARPKSGFYVRPAWPQKVTGAEARHRRQFAGGAGNGDVLGRIYESASRFDFVPLGVACPSPDLMPGAKLARFLARAARETMAQSIFYIAPPGYEPLRRQIATRAADAGCSLSPDEIVTTSGCMEAISLSLAAITNPGDTVAVESPFFYAAFHLLKTCGLNACEIATDPKTGMDIDALESGLRKHRIAAVIAIPNFSDPLGARMPDGNKRRLVELITKHEVPLIEDDIHGDLGHRGERPRAAKSYDRKGLVLWCGSFSKSLVPGFRVGWIAAGRWQESIKRLQFSRSICPSSPTQIAVANFLAERGYDHHLRALRKAYAEQVAHVTAAVAEHFPAHVRLTRPEGGFLVWVELPERVDAMRLQGEAFAEKISIVPGPMFSVSGLYTNCIRLSCGFPWSSEVERAIALLGTLAKRQLSRGGR